MTNYFTGLIVATALCAAACSAAETPPATRPAAKPAAQAVAAPPAAPFSHYVQAGTGASLTFTFTQAGAVNTGSFGKFVTAMSYNQQNHTAGALDVTVQIGSLATQDRDRDDTLKSADLFDAAKHPTAHYSATAFATGPKGDLVADGKLTMRGVTRELRLPLRVRAAAGGLELSGAVTIKRLDFGIGQGDWQATDSVGDDVKLQFIVPLVTAD